MRAEFCIPTVGKAVPAGAGSCPPTCSDSLRELSAILMERRRTRPKWSKGTWYVSFEAKEPVYGRTHSRLTESFQTEQEAKAFARAKLAEGPNVTAGTLNPHLPKRTINSQQMLVWLDEADR
jgi:hypothetical protein